MDITYLGHQGWAFHNNRQYVLMDAIYEAIGNGAGRLPVWPCRTLDFSKINPVAAIIISHEHSDHFDLHSLINFPFRCTVWIPYLSSAGMETTLKQLGYTVKRMKAFETFTIAGMRFTPLCMDYNLLEFDVYGMLVQANKDESFMTVIDAIPSEELDGWLAQHCPHRTLDNYTNNLIEPLPYLCDEDRDARYSVSSLTMDMIGYIRRFQPTSCTITGQGWCYNDPYHNYLNRLFFNVTNKKMLNIAKEVFPHVNWAAPKPGDCFDLKGNKVTRKQKPLVIPRRSPARDYVYDGKARDIKPWSKKKKLDPADLQEVINFVQYEYGKVIEGHAPVLMKGLHRLVMRNDGEHIPALFLQLRDGNDYYNFALHYGKLQFEKASDFGNPFERYATGLQLWASDLSLLLQAKEEAFLIYETSIIRWNHYPELTGELSVAELFRWFAPRYRSEAYLKAYQERIKELS